MTSGLVIANQVVTLSGGKRTGVAAQLDANEMPAVFRETVCFTIGIGSLDALESPQCHPVLPGQCSLNSRTYIPTDPSPIIVTQNTGSRSLVPCTNPPTFSPALTGLLIAPTVAKALSCSFGGASVVVSRSYRIPPPPSEVRYFNLSDVHVYLLDAGLLWRRSCVHVCCWKFFSCRCVILLLVRVQVQASWNGKLVWAHMHSSASPMRLYSEHADDICFLVTIDKPETTFDPSLADGFNDQSAGASEGIELLELGSTLGTGGIAVNKQWFRSGLVQQTGHLHKKRASFKSVMSQSGTNTNALPPHPGEAVLRNWLEAEACNPMPLLHKSVCNLTSSLVFGNGSTLDLRAARSANPMAEQGGNVQVLYA